jgi:hypothetical protein
MNVSHIHQLWGLKSNNIFNNNIILLMFVILGFISLDDLLFPYFLSLEGKGFYKKQKDE